MSTSNDFFIGVATFQRTFPRRATPYRASFSSCCRVSTLIDGNRDNRFNVVTRIPTAAGDVNEPPVSPTLPIIHLTHGSFAQVPLPAADPNADALTYTFAPLGSPTSNPAASGLDFIHPGFYLTTDGVLVYQAVPPSQVGLHAFQVLVTDEHGLSTPVDFLVNLVPPCPVGDPQCNQAPALTVNGSLTPVMLDVLPGVEIDVVVVGTDPDGDMVSVAVSNVPPGLQWDPIPDEGANNVGVATHHLRWTPPLGAPPVAVSFQAFDDRGAVSMPNSVTLDVITNRAPVVTCPAPLTLEATSAQGANGTLSVDVSDPDGDDPLTVDWEIGGAVAQSDVVNGGAGTVGRTQSFPIGTTTVSVTADDGNGGVAGCSVDVTVADTTPPAIVVPADIVREATQSFTPVDFVPVPSASDAVDPAPTLSCDRASGSGFPVATTTVTCSGSDATGNSDTATFDVTIIDTTPPVVTPPADIEVEGDTTGGTFVSNPAILAFIGSGPGGASATDLVTGSGLTVTSDAPGFFPLGPTVVTFSAADGQVPPNVGTAQATVTVVDTTAPTVTPSGDVIVEATSAAGAVVTFTLPAASDVVDANPVVDCVSTTGLGSGSVFPLGATTVTCTATDGEGNTAEVPFDVTVHDTTLPELTAPANIIVEQDGPAGTVVVYTEPVATDLVDVTVPATCLPAPGTTFAGGQTTATCTATDAAGNQAQASFTIDVVDTTPPVFPAPPNVVVEQTSPTGNVVNYPIPTATDTVDLVVTASCVPASGTTFSPGVTPVACTATDAAGNGTPASFTVSVLDTTAPQLTVPASFNVFPTTPGGEVVTFVATATDVADLVPVVACTPASGSLFPIGTTMVSCTATDASGNVATDGFDVTVDDPTPPVVVPSVVGTPGANGWFISDVAVSWMVTDPESPITDTTGCDATVLTVDTTGTAFTCAATSLGGTTSETVTVLRDVTPPVIAATTDPPANAAGWHNTAVTVIFNVSDATSGVVSATPPIPVDAEGLTQVSGTAMDAAGNTSSVVLDVKIDSVAPEAYNVFDPLTKDVLVFAVADDGSPVSDGPIVPTVEQVFWHDRGAHKYDDDDDDDDDDRPWRRYRRRHPRRDALLRTYEVSDDAGNTLTLTEKVRRKWWSLEVRVTGLQYASGGVLGDLIVPALAKKYYVWSTNRRGEIRRLTQLLWAGRGREARFGLAFYHARRDRTLLITGKPFQRERRDGLVLLRMVTDAGQLDIEY